MGLMSEAEQVAGDSGRGGLVILEILAAANVQTSRSEIKKILEGLRHVDLLPKTVQSKLRGHLRDEVTAVP